MSLDLHVSFGGAGGLLWGWGLGLEVQAAQVAVLLLGGPQGPLDVAVDGGVMRREAAGG